LYKNGIEKFATPRCQSAAGIIIAVIRRRLHPAVTAVNQLGGLDWLTPTQKGYPFTHTGTPV